MIVFVSGLPKAGKSVTTYAVVDRLRRLGRSVFLERVHPDQEGNWTIESPGGQEAARAIKNRLKAAGTFWSDQFVNHACRSVAGLARCFPLVLADMGGIPSPQNRQIVEAGRAASRISALILRRANQDSSSWEKFWREAGVPFRVVETRFGDAPFDEARQQAVEAVLEAIQSLEGSG